MAVPIKIVTARDQRDPSEPRQERDQREQRGPGEQQEQRERLSHSAAHACSEEGLRGDQLDPGEHRWPREHREPGEQQEPDEHEDQGEQGWPDESERRWRRVVGKARRLEFKRREFGHLGNHLKNFPRPQPRGRGMRAQVTRAR